MNEAALQRKHDALHRIVAAWPTVIVAYSGGVDSALVAVTATQLLGRRALCVTADSPSYPDHHRALALGTARRFGLHHEIVATRELEQPHYRANPANRCYYCKHELYTRLAALARARRVAVLADGSNADDRADYRPGREAAREFGVRSPLDEAGLTKPEVRELARRAGLPTWNEPASACLSSRIPYFSEVTEAKLRMIERAEQALRQLGFRVCRVRHQPPRDRAGDARDSAVDLPVARVEVGADELARGFDPSIAAAVDRALRRIGYGEVTFDLRGYRSGRLNEALLLRAV